MAVEAPYGAWKSPITPASLVEQAVGLSQVVVAGERIYWNEARAAEAGRQVIVAVGTGGEPTDLLAPGWSARTQVHEYGGQSFAVQHESVVFSNWADQRLWRLRPGGDPEPVTAEPPFPRSVRFADPVISPDGRWVLCVRERHDGEVVNDIVAVDLESGEVKVLAAGHDFYAAPRVSPDGARLAWLSWDHPDMPWDQTELWVAPFAPDGTVGAATRLAGGDGESVTQPRWSPAGSLHYISDRTGWWNLYDEAGEALAPMEAEFAGPDWVFGLSSYAFTPDNALVATWEGAHGTELGVVDGGHVTPLALPFSLYSFVQAVPDGVVAVAGSPTEAPAVVRITLDGHTRVLRRSRERAVDAGFVSAPRRVDFPTGGGATAHAWFYPPVNADFSGPAGERPPLLVTIHGGPTSAAMPVLNLAVQYWTSRGFAVADVDYRGSSGYGRAYRDLLRRAWGVADVEDCAAVVAWLAGLGWVDGSRAVIRGGSAGGFTTLAALAFADAFAAGASLYGVADLELLARDTHKFEARYLDRLVGPYPEAAEIYRDRSPIHHVEQIDRPVILFQGLEDAVVPPAQSELMYQALAGRGVPVAYLAFEGEQHGFRQASTITRVAEAELAFYGRVLGFEPPDAGAPVPIANEAAL